MAAEGTVRDPRGSAVPMSTFAKPNGSIWPRQKHTLTKGAVLHIIAMHCGRNHCASFAPAASTTSSAGFPALESSREPCPTLRVNTPLESPYEFFSGREYPILWYVLCTVTSTTNACVYLIITCAGGRPVGFHAKAADVSDSGAELGAGRGQRRRG